ncbi:MAG: hypothetical protein ACU0CO_17870 [Shimia sp.]
MPVYAFLTLLFAITFAGSSLVIDGFAGFEAAQLPIPQENPPIQPAGYAFAIWGVIYLWLIVGSAYGLWRRAQDPAWNRARPALIVSLFIGTFWLWIATQSVLWATVTIWMMLGTAVAAMLAAPAQDRWLLRAPIALYAGWLSAASFVALAVLLAGYGIGFGQMGWALVGVPVATLFAAAIQMRAATAMYGVTVIWAFVAIVVANGAAAPMVSGLAALGAVVVILLAVRAERA